MANCEICGADSETRYDFRYPNSNNEDTTVLVCKSCHESIRVLINQFIDSLDETSTVKLKDYYPVRYPNLNNADTVTYIKYEDYRELEDEINIFIENGGL